MFLKSDLICTTVRIWVTAKCPEVAGYKCAISLLNTVILGYLITHRSVQPIPPPETTRPTLLSSENGGHV